MQVAFNGLLRWVLHLPMTTCMEFLHILGNLPPPPVLIAKQLVSYMASLWVPPVLKLGTLPLPPPGQPCHATRVWDAILATKLPLDDPLAVAPIYWQQFVLHQGTAPSVANLYTVTHTLLWARLEEAAAAHGEIAWAGTLEIWLHLLPHLFATLDTRHMLPRPWQDSLPDLRGTQLRLA